MQFADIIGNGELKQRLAQMVDDDRLSHAILLTESGDWGGVAIATALAQYVNCEHPHDGDSCGECNSCHKYSKLIHPDLHYVFPVSSSKDLSEAEKKAPISDYFVKDFRELLLYDKYFGEQTLYEAIGLEGKSGIIGVNEARRIFEKLSLKSFEGKYKTMVIYLPEKMNQEAANKLLKLLEEPPAGTLFILVSHAPEKILSTIRSRCQMIQLMPLSREERKAAGKGTQSNPEFQELLTGIIKAGLGKALADTIPIWEALAEMGREKQKDFCIYSENYIRKLYMAASAMDSIAEYDTSEEAAIRELAPKIKPAFYERAFNAFETAIASVESNVNAKLTFCNLCNILYTSL
ncbi:MAG: hypothetical protein MJY60_07080 [Bacteroidales bacterium]|nr:hypothetical protein [Bacteroidales bacterium]